MIYKEKPEGFVPDVEVTGCFILVGDEFLLLHRAANKWEGGRWGPPGGKVDKGDKDLIEAVKREAKEETGIVISEKDLNFYKTFFVVHSNGKFFYHCFSCKLQEKPNIALSEREHQDFKWVTIEEALKMPLVTDEDYCLKDFYKIK